MEHKEVKASELFTKVLKAIVPFILWMLFVIYVGMYFGWMFFGERPTLGNYLFYGFTLFSLVAIIYGIIKMMNKKK